MLVFLSLIHISLLKPILFTGITINTFWFWNDFLLPQLIISDETLRTIPDVYKRQAWTFANTQLDIDYQKTTINGQKIEEYESGHLLPYSDEDLLNTGLDENVYDAVLESRFSLDGDLGENPEVHLVLGAYQNENLGEDYFAEFEFDFSIPHEELMKQTVHKKLEDVSVKTEEGTVKLTDLDVYKRQVFVISIFPSGRNFFQGDL